MLFWLIDRLSTFWPDANLAASLDGFSKITFRAAIAALVSFILAVIFGPFVIAWLTQRFREPPSDRAPQLRDLHKHKAWTPTMGGLFLVAGILATALLVCDWQNSRVAILMANLLWLAMIGAVDDLLKLSGRSKTGLRPAVKLAAQIAVVSIVAIWLYQLNRDVPGGIDLQLPLFGRSISLGVAFVPVAILVIVGSSNAVNLTDGLDGLAAGSLVLATGAIAVMAYVAGHADLAAYLGVIHVPGVGEAVVVAAATIGATLGFLWFNCHPAQVFMGDTGSLALGGTLGLLALMAKQELLLAVVGGVFVAEAVSVIVQIYVHRWTGRRVFRCAPLHHHFQLLGWAENKIVMRFWIASILCAVLGLGILKLNRLDDAARTDRANLAEATGVVPR